MIRLAALLALLAAPAAAQAACGPLEAMGQKLGDTYGEAPEATYLSGAGVLQVWRNPDGGTWTMLALDPRGVACIVAAGVMWEAAPDARPKPNL